METLEPGIPLPPLLPSSLVCRRLKSMSHRMRPKKASNRRCTIRLFVQPQTRPQHFHPLPPPLLSSLFSRAGAQVASIELALAMRSDAQ